MVYNSKSMEKCFKIIINLIFCSYFVLIKIIKFQLNFDSDGRVVLPKKLLDHSGIKETVVFVGQGKTFQMWEPQKFSKFREEARKKAKTLRSDLKWS